MYLCYRKARRGEISRANRRCKYVLEAVGVNRRVVRRKASGLENCGAAIILMFLRSCSALHLSSTPVSATATDEHDSRDFVKMLCPYKCKMSTGIARDRLLANMKAM
jgi:hypothetical protein